MHPLPYRAELRAIGGSMAEHDQVVDSRKSAQSPRKLFLAILTRRVEGCGAGVAEPAKPEPARLEQLVVDVAEAVPGAKLPTLFGRFVITRNHPHFAALRLQDFPAFVETP